MKKTALSFCFILLMVGCKKQTLSTHTNNHMQVLQVSYVGYNFIGGKALTFSSNDSTADSIPVSTVYVSPSDFGSIAFTHTPSNQKFFDATIIWMGTGRISYPQSFDAPSGYTTMSTAIAQPDSNTFQRLGPQMQHTPYDSIWAAVSKLTVTSNMISQNCKIGLYCYTPSVGIGNPNEWSWLIYLYK